MTDPHEPIDPAKLRVAFFSDSLPERNGTGAYYHDLLQQLAPRVEALEIFQPQDIERPPLLSWPMPGDSSQRLVLPDMPRIARAVRRLRPHVVVTITPGPFGLLGLYHARRQGSAFISAFHTDFEELARIYWKPHTRLVVNGYLRNANKYLCKRSRTVLINNSKLADDVTRLGAPSTETMGTPIQGKFLRRPLRPFPAAVERVCFAGRLAAEKNIDRILDTAERIPGVEFVIGGDGPFREPLRRAASALPNVRFVGWLSRDELIDLIDSSSLLLLPSRIETFGSVALEAMARGRPALVSSNAGIHDWPQLRPGLYAYDQDRPLADFLEGSVLGDAAQLQAKAAAARPAAEQFNNESVEQWLRIFQNYAAKA